LLILLNVIWISQKLCTQKLVCTNLRKSWAPSKVCGFSWLLLLDKIPTMSTLFRRGIIMTSLSIYCLWCWQLPENLTRLFLHCDFVSRIWYMKCSGGLGEHILCLWNYSLPFLCCSGRACVKNQNEVNLDVKW
jgi:hypothetical protein